MVVIYDENLNEIDDFLDYCRNKNLKFIVVSSTENKEHFVKKELVQTELLEKILSYLGK